MLQSELRLIIRKSYIRFSHRSTKTPSKVVTKAVDHVTLGTAFHASIWLSPCPCANLALFLSAKPLFVHGTNKISYNFTFNWPLIPILQNPCVILS